MTKLLKEIELDCGDNSCLFAKKKGGMRTNGGCRCFEAHGFYRSQIRSAQAMLPEIIGLRSELDKVRKAAKLYYEQSVPRPNVMLSASYWDARDGLYYTLYALEETK